MKHCTLNRTINILVAIAALTPVTATQAQTLLSGDHSLDGQLCLGQQCTGNENYPGDYPLNLKEIHTGIYFEDTSTAGSGNPFADWEIRINDNFSGGQNYFAIRDVSEDGNVFQIENNAPDNSFYLDSNGEIGLGTSLPTANLHIVDSSLPDIRLQRPGTGGSTEADWRITAGASGFVLVDALTSSLPFAIENGAPRASIWVDDSGDVGISTEDPDAALHVRRADGTARVLVQNSPPSPSAVREMFAMRNNGGSYFTLDNTDSDTTWFFVHEGAAPNRFIISDGVADGPEMTLSADGILTVEGGFVAGATTLNVPDYVFAEDYTLRPLSEVASFIETHSHLPDVPSADRIANDGLNMTEMQMTLLKKVEELTLYTLAQEKRIKAQDRINADLIARLEMLE